MSAPCPSPDQPFGQPQPASAEVESQLLGLGLSAQPLSEAMRAGYEDASRCTSNDVVNRIGWVLWATPLRYLGDEYVSQGWTRGHPGGFEILLNAEKTVALTIAPGSYATGTEAMPSTRIDRGPMTGQVTVGNRYQQRLDPSASPLFREDAPPATMTYLLLHYYDEDVQEIRQELSLPVEFDRAGSKSKRGFVTRFEARMILPPIPMVELPDDGDSDDGFEIPIERR
jgi:hypothetical protein